MNVAERPVRFFLDGGHGGRSRLECGDAKFIKLNLDLDSRCLGESGAQMRDHGIHIDL